MISIPNNFLHDISDSVHNIPHNEGVNDFISVWDTTKISPNSSNATQIELPLVEGGEYDFTVKWGDGEEIVINSWDDPNTLHNYAAGHSYVVNITGTLRGWSFKDSNDSAKITSIEQWGCFEFGSTGEYAFSNCINL